MLVIVEQNNPDTLDSCLWHYHLQSFDVNEKLGFVLALTGYEIHTIPGLHSHSKCYELQNGLVVSLATRVFISYLES